MAGLLPGEGPGVEGPRISWALARSLSRARACQGIEGGYVFQRMLPRWRAAAREVPFTSCRDPQPPAREQAFRVPARGPGRVGMDGTPSMRTQCPVARLRESEVKAYPRTMLERVR